MPETAHANFFSSGLRPKVDQLMNTLWAGGVNNPMDSIEQCSYLIFLRLLSDRDEQAALIERGYQRIFSGDWSRYAWGNFVTLTGSDLFDALRGAIEKLHELPGLSTTGQMLFRNATLKIYDRPTLKAVVETINKLELGTGDGPDVKGDMYEYLLSKLSQSGTNGQFRTPRHIIDLIVALVAPQPGWRICDPACGTAGFLISAYQHILRKHTKPADLARGVVDGSQLKPKQWDFLNEHAFTGYDNDANMVKIAILNLYLHQLDRARIQHFNPLTTKQNGQYPGQLFDAILANPPFAGRVQKESILADISLETRDTELLFLKWVLDHLAVGGRAGVIVPNGVLFGSGKADRKVRELLLTSCDLQAVIALPSGVFKPYSGVGTAILIFQKVREIESKPSDAALQPATQSVWFYELTADGYSLDDKRTDTPDKNDIPDILSKWRGREEGPNSFRVSVGKIRDNGWQLIPGRYKAVEFDAQVRDRPREILSDFVRLGKRTLDQAMGIHLVTKRGRNSWPVQSISELLSLEYGKSLPEAVREDSGSVLVVGSNGVQGKHSKYLVKGPGIVIGRKGSAGEVNWYEENFWPIDTTYFVVPARKINMRWLYYTLRVLPLKKYATATGVPGLNRNDVYALVVPVPPPEEQTRIVAILDEVRSLELVQTAACQRLGDLSQALLYSAFKGEL